MTTLVYDHSFKQIAIDSRITQGDMIATDSFTKWVRSDGILIFLTGSTSDYDLLVDAIVNDVKPCRKIQASAMFVTEDGVVSLAYPVSGGNIRIERAMFSDAMGSGAPYALTALDLGLRARASVEQAAKRDTATGGKVHVFDVMQMEFVTK